MANERAICRFRTCQEIKNKERDQYKEAVWILNMELTAKLALLEKETHHCEELEKMTTNLMIELAGLREQIKKAKVDVVAAFRTSQPYFDECGIYYGDGFDDCLKQVAAFHLDLDLSQVVIDDTISSTHEGTNTISNETHDSVHTVKEELKDPVLRLSFSVLLKAWLLPWSRLLLMACLLWMACLLRTLLSLMLPHLDFYPFLSCL